MTIRLLAITAFLSLGMLVASPASTEAAGRHHRDDRHGRRARVSVTHHSRARSVYRSRAYRHGYVQRPRSYRYGYVPRSRGYRYGYAYRRPVRRHLGRGYVYYTEPYYADPYGYDPYYYDDPYRLGPVIVPPPPYLGVRGGLWIGRPHVRLYLGF